MIRIPFIWLRKNWPRLAVVALALPCAVSCATIREDVDEEDDTPLTFEERLMNREGKKFDKKTFDAYSRYSSAPKHGYQTASFRSKRFNEISTVIPKRYDTELYNAGDANEQKRKWFNFRGRRNKDSKSSIFARGRSREDGKADLLGTRRFPVSWDLETVLSRRSGGITPTILNPDEPAAGEPSPTVLRQPTLSRGDLGTLMNGP